MPENHPEPASDTGTNGSTEGKWIPPYIGWSNFLHLVDKLENNQPARIDRSFLTGSNAVNTITLAALRSLDMIDGEGRLQPPLVALATQPDERKKVMREILRRFYPEPVALGSTNATQLQLEEAFGRLGVSGDTRRKAVVFFLKAAQFAEIPLSPNFRTPSISRADGSPVRKMGKRKRQSAAPAALAEPSEPSTEHAGTTVTSDKALSSLLPKYVEMLMQKVSEADTLDPELLNRIESLLVGKKTESAEG